MKSGESRWIDFTQQFGRWHWSVLLLIFVVSPGWIIGGAVPELRKIMLGHAVQLSCYPPHFTPNMKYFIVQWRKQGNQSPVLLWRDGQVTREGRGYEGRVSLLARASLFIEDLRRTDKGLYECQTWDVNGHPLSNASTMEVDILDVVPKFTLQPRNLLIAAGGETEFNCVTDPPADSIRWQLNGSYLNVSTSSSRLQIRISLNLQEQIKQQGTYECIVAWGNSALHSIPANLTIAGISPFKEQETVKITAIEGGYAVLLGSLPYSTPTAIPIVMHNGTLLPTTTPRTMLMPSGNLHIQGVRPGDSGWYQFSALNSFINERVTARNSVMLEVAKPDKKYSPQLLAAPKESNVAVLGGNVTLECAASGNPIPRISWSKYGGILPVGRYQQVLGNLFLFDLRPNDTGTYVCEADNGVEFPVSTISTLDVLEAPEIHKWVAEYEVREREEVTLECSTKGHVRHAISWFHDGSLVNNTDNAILRDSKLIIKTARRNQAGFYQCFASNGAGISVAVARVRVVPRSAPNEEVTSPGGRRREHAPHFLDRNWDRGINSTFMLTEDDPEPSEMPEEERHTKKHTKRKKKKKKPKYGHAEGDSKVVMIPPTRPEITKLSDESVMVRWDVPPNAGLPILFFKVQYKDITKQSSRWMTIDEDIAPHILSYEVPNLKTGHIYRFRIAAVYSNNDNKLGPNSHKFTLQKDPPTKKPVVGPTIIHAEAISPSAIMIRWQYLDIDEVPIEGFFIYYRTTTSAGHYTKVTVLGASTASHIISHLLPETAYDIKMQCFNSAGTSDFSNIRTEKTLASVNPDDKSKDEDDSLNGLRDLPPVSNTVKSDQLLYTILGIVLGSLTLMLIVFVAYCSWKQRKRQKRQSIHTTHNKENGHALHDQGKYMAVNGSPANGHAGNLNGVLLWNKSEPRREHEANEMMETSLTESPPVVLNNNNNERHEEEDVDLDSNQSDEEEPMNQRTTACKPLIHRKEDEYNSSDSCSEDDESGHPSSEVTSTMADNQCNHVTTALPPAT